MITFYRQKDKSRIGSVDVVNGELVADTLQTELLIDGWDARGFMKKYKRFANEIMYTETETTMKRRMTVPVSKAVELANGVANEELRKNLLAALAQILDLGWDVVNIEADSADGGYEVRVSQPTGAIVGLFLPRYVREDVAFPGGEAAEDLHVTLCYLGEASALSLDQQRKIIGIVGEVALETETLRGELGGVDTFDGNEEEYPFWVGVNVPGLVEFRERLAAALDAAGFPLVGKGVDNFTPHVTVAYIEQGQEPPNVNFDPLEVIFDHVTVAIGGNRFEIALAQSEYDDLAAYKRPGWIPEAINKAVEVEDERRFTLAPWYVPQFLDAHGEWTDTDEIQKALWGYVEKGNRDIRLQHNTEIVAGRWVEAVTWPTEFSTTLTKANGETTEHTFPSGTPFLGVVWEPWAWKLVKEGKITGYSIGGKTSFMEVGIEGAEDAAPSD